jgi:hypothetical protein
MSRNDALYKSLAQPSSLTFKTELGQRTSSLSQMTEPASKKPGKKVASTQTEVIFCELRQMFMQQTAKESANRQFSSFRNPRSQRVNLTFLKPQNSQESLKVYPEPYTGPCRSIGTQTLATDIKLGQPLTLKPHPVPLRNETPSSILPVVPRSEPRQPRKTQLIIEDGTTSVKIGWPPSRHQLNLRAL